MPLTAVLALVFNAFAWGISWWPFRRLESLGLHPLWSTAAIYSLCIVAIVAWRPRAPAHLLRTPSLWLLLLASGTTNAAFNWGVVAGDVVRVVLLFYLMPLWSLLLARVLLGERLTRRAALRVVLSLCGAAIVLWPAGGAAGGWHLGLAEALGLAGGFSFALNNVMLRRLAGEPEAARALAMFVGGMLVSLSLALLLPMLPAVAGGEHLAAAIPPPRLADPWVLAGLAGLAALFLGSNLALQYGAVRLPAGVTAVVMPTEILFAAGSAVALGSGTLTPAVAVGGLLIVSAVALSSLGGAARKADATPPAP